MVVARTLGMVNPVGVLSLKDALEGPWAANTRSWVILFVPASLLVAFQDAQTPFSSLWFTLASAVAQHLVGGLILLSSAAVARWRLHRMPLGISVMAWVAVGVARGLIGGWFAETFAGADPNEGWRILFWVILSVVWIPAFAFASAQLEHRRFLLAQLRREQELLVIEHSHSADSVDALAASVISALRYSIGPVISEIHESLSNVAKKLNPLALRSISDRLVELSDEATRLVRNSSRRAASAGVTEIGDNELKASRAPLSAAIDFTQSRPISVLVVTALLVLGLIVPNAMLSSRNTNVAILIVAILASVIALGCLFWLRRGLKARIPRVSFERLTAGCLGSGLFGSAVFIIALGRPPTNYEVLIAAFLPVALASAGLLVPVTVGIERANAELVDDIATVRAEHRSLASLRDLKEERARTQLAIVLHGQLHGRLAACVMALKFSSKEKDPHKLAVVAESVLQHLASASTDLDALTTTPPDRG
ncbi:MAG: hypothetical protein LH471_02320 [Salinibacterium sp.]|nr:hypothetical protein [Salinibacterium sp.]